MKRNDLRQWSDGASGPSLKLVPDLSWMDRGECRKIGPGPFFPERGGSTGDAKTACQSCPVRRECLDFALESGQEWGRWGGVVFEDGIPQSGEDVCPEGHPWTGASTYLTPGGTRKCRTCRNARARDGRPERGLSETCDEGHPWTEASTFHRAGGDRRCRICKNAYNRRYRQSQKAAA
jgi:hypothetical protein